MSLALQIEGLGKEYQLNKSEKFWALKDINLDLQQGEVLGLIGPNGAGKSTLLKLLSRISAPSSGSIKAYGRIASLLEVGTGFHPDLSGRDNIYLNGSILGMKRSEIKARFDEIVAFAGVEKFLDMPVKRYSSGMYVRLAFSVAAHLDSEILLIDEVLAVGDADFQKKCLQRMESLSASKARSIIFVSHNLQAIQGLCDRVALISEGKLLELGPSEKTIARYQQELSTLHEGQSPADRKDREGDGRAQLLELKTKAANSASSVIKSGQDLQLSVSLALRDTQVSKIRLSLHLFNEAGNYLSSLDWEQENQGEAQLSLQCLLPEIPLMAGKFFWNCHIYLDGIRADFLGRAHYFEVMDEGFEAHEIAHQRRSPGFKLKQNWS